MKHNVIVFLFVLFTLNCLSQNIKVNEIDSYKLFVETLNNSKDLRYNDILEAYNSYIKSNPKDVVVQVYKCKFIGNAFVDPYEEYNLKYEETNACINELYKNYPKHPDVIIYNLENAHYEDQENLIKEGLSAYYEDKSTWTYQKIGRFYEIAAHFYEEEDDFRAIKFAEDAERFSDSLDLSVLLTKAHIRRGNKSKAKTLLMDGLYYDNDAWILQQKGNLLIEFGETDEAIKMFDRVKEKDSSFSNNESLYKVFIEKQDYNQARQFLINDTIDDWNKASSLQKLLNHDISYSDGETTLSSYRRMQELSYYDDFFGIKRLQIFFKSPFKFWTIKELSHIVLLVGFIVVIFLLPYVWILPIYAANKFLKLKPIASDKRIPVDWSLKHFWLVSFLYLTSQVLMVFIFYYQDYINAFFDIAYTYIEDEFQETQLFTANTVLVYSLLVFSAIFMFLNKKRMKFVLHTNLRYLRVFVLSIMFLLFNAIVLKCLKTFIPIEDGIGFIQSLNMKPEMTAMLHEYGFGISVLVVAVLVPFYEEIIFRGIILSSTEKKLGFKWANVIQAVLFGIVHFNLGLFLFYFSFGLITGYAVKRSNGLLTGIVFHAVNNFFALLAIYMLTRYLPNF
ncbi:type II CAAX prenyl endopeptidase Rce1 family protein [Psychroserpens sp. S379A]|uniref:CPBP family glutamic-type intramembrane protease n=1 Tax=Psychroserpens sp. S379A TaxID=3415137 RepID=UPI003C7B7E2B